MKITKIYRVIDGKLWRWESDGEYIRMVKLSDDREIKNFAEKLINELNNKNNKIIYNLN